MIWPFHVSQCWLCVGYIYIPLNVACYLVYNEVTDEQIITIFHLVLQVHCSPSLKEQVHNPVMPLLARTRERKESILCSYGGVCAYTCVMFVCECTFMFVCCMWVCGCVYMRISVYICVSAFRMVDASLQVYVHVSVITQVK